MTQKFTAMEWATMEGGHGLPEVKDSSFSFIKDLHESRLTRQQSSTKTLTYTDCCERAYLTLLILEVLRNFPDTSPIASGYAKKTSGHDNYDYFRMNSTDLYNFVYFIVGDDKAQDKLKDPEAAKRMRKTTTLPVMALNRYVSKLAKGMKSNIQDQTDFINIESALGIKNTDYRTIRRQLFSFTSISNLDKKKLVTRLVLASRAKLRSSDIIQYLEDLSARKDLELFRVSDPEPTISSPDITVTPNDMLSYRYLVGDKNLMMTKRFLELAKAGKSIPSNVAQAYLPAIQLIDDIAKAGPGYTQQLRVLANRAKKASKK
jgi:hypothetical protein